MFRLQTLHSWICTSNVNRMQRSQDYGCKDTERGWFATYNPRPFLDESAICEWIPNIKLP